MDLSRRAPSSRHSSGGICHRFLSRLPTREADGLAVLLYVQRDACCDTAKRIILIEFIGGVN